MKPYLRFPSYIPGILILAGGYLLYHAPAYIKNKAETALQTYLTPLGIDQVHIESVRLGWGHLYLRNVKVNSTSSVYSLRMSEINLDLSAFVSIKTIDVTEAILTLQTEPDFSFFLQEWQNKYTHLKKIRKTLLSFPVIPLNIRHGSVIVPSSIMSPGSNRNVAQDLKIPFQIVTSITDGKKQVLSLKWGENNYFSGQLTVKVQDKAIAWDAHVINAGMQTSALTLKAPEIFWHCTEKIEPPNFISYQTEGLATLDQLDIDSFGKLKAPLKINLQATGTGENLVINKLTILHSPDTPPPLTLRGILKPDQLSGEITASIDIPHLKHLWDFSPLLASQEKEEVTIDGAVAAKGEILCKGGCLTTPGISLNIKNMQVKGKKFSLEGGSAALVVDSLVPLQARGIQDSVAARLTLSGIDLRNIQLEGFSLNEDTLKINQMTASLLNGTLKAHSFRRQAYGSSFCYQFDAEFKDIDLAEVLKLTVIRNLKGQGILEGNASLQYDYQQGLQLIQADFHSVSETGLIQYKTHQEFPENAESTQQEANKAALAPANDAFPFQIFQNFHFTLLTVHLTQTLASSLRPESQMQGTIKLLGSNPDVLNGYPFEFEIVSTGQLEDLIINRFESIQK